jgi:hypothetical protein
MFAESIRQWSAAVHEEIAERSLVNDNAEINEYNKAVVFGLTLSHAMMQDAMKRQLPKQPLPMEEGD